MTRSFYYHLGTAGAVATAFALLVRLLLRDRVPYLATVFYAAPPVLIASGALACAIAWTLARRRRLALAALTAALVCAAWQAGVSRFSHPRADGDLRLLLWNTANGGAGWGPLGSDIDVWDADLTVLVEANGGKPELMPSGSWRWLSHGLAVGVRGTIVSAEAVAIGEGSWAEIVKVEVRGRPLTALLVDVGAHPLRPRGLAFEPLDVLRRRVKPDLILGDFNTPRDSVYFDGWRGELRHAFEAAGDGWEQTWPWPVRVLSLDHVWCAPTLTPVYARNVGRSTSDHAQVVVELK